MKQLQFLIVSTLVLGMVVYCNVGTLGMSLKFDDPMYSMLDEESRQLLMEYVSAYPKIKDFYRNIRMDVTLRTFRYTADEKFRRYIPLAASPLLENEMSFEVRYNNVTVESYSRYDFQIKYTRPDGPDAHQQDYYPRQIAIISPDSAFELTRYNEEKQHYALNLKRKVDDYRNNVGVLAWKFDTAPFGCDGRTMEEILFRRPSFIEKNTPCFIDSVKVVSDGGENFVEIVLRIVYSSEEVSRRTIRLERDTWLVRDIFFQNYYREQESSPPVMYWAEYSVEYDKSKEGIPLMSRYNVDTGKYNDDGSPTERLRSLQYEFTQIIPGPPDLSEFDVAQFLPPGVKIGKDISPAHFSPIRIAAIVVGLILFILGIYMKIRIALREKRNNKP